MKIKPLPLIFALSLVTTFIFYQSYNLVAPALTAGFLLSVLDNKKNTSLWYKSKKTLLYVIISALTIDVLLLILDFDEGVHLFSASFFLSFGVLIVASGIGSLVGNMSRRILNETVRMR